MTNPFSALNISDDQDEFQTVDKQQKVKRTHQEKKQFKIQQESTKTNTNNQPQLIQQVPDRIKEDAKQIRSKRAPPTPLTKKLGEGHYLDRRSGTGRDDKPRKEGGGRGNVGNIKDDLNQDKYIKQPIQGGNNTQVIAETQETKVEPKPEEPQKLTLEEYYKSKGIEISSTFEKKTVVRGQVNAQWIKKQKLTVIQSKQDKKNSERNAPNVLKFTQAKVGLSQTLEGLGFGQKPSKRVQEKREYKNDHKGKDRKQKVIIDDSDFPAL